MLSFKKSMIAPLLLLALLLAGCTGAAPNVELPTALPSLPSLPPDAALQAQTALSDMLGVKVTDVQILSTEQVDWPDACLGLPQSGQACAQVVTPGWKIVLQANGQQYTYRTSADGQIIRLESPQVTPTPGDELTPTPAGGSAAIQVYLVALEDNGQTGQLIGCGDSLVPVEQSAQAGAAEPEAALQALLAIKDQYYGQSGLYNALYQSDLQVENVQVDDAGQATIQLTGQVKLGGECDTPRFKSQLEQTALQFPSVQNAAILINGQPMQEVLSSQG